MTRTSNNYIIFPGDSKSWNKSWISMFTCFSLKTMDFDVKHLKLQKLLVFGMAIGCPGCFLRSEGWVEQSESCHWKHWKSPAKIPQNSHKYLQIPKGERTFSDSRGLGMAPLGSVALSNDMEHLKLLKSLESGNSWFFPREWIPGCLELMP